MSRTAGTELRGFESHPLRQTHLQYRGAFALIDERNLRAKTYNAFKRVRPLIAALHWQSPASSRDE